MALQRSWTTDIGLRALGLASCGGAYLAIAQLVRLHEAVSGRWSPGIVACGLAAAGFLLASIGGAMAVLGRHLFDDIAVGERWRARGRLHIAPPARVTASTDRGRHFRPAPVKEASGRLPPPFAYRSIDTRRLAHVGIS